MTLRRLLAAVTVLLIALGAVPAQAAQPTTWNFTQAGIGSAQPAGRSGDGVTVAVIDTWVDGSHPDFGGRVLAGAHCLAGTGCSPGQRPDACHHGTHVAGTIASASFGVAPAARILPVQVLTAGDSSGNSCSGSLADIAAGIDYAVGAGATVLNLSLGSLVPGISSSSVITAAVRRAHDRGAVVVFAAGNSSLPLADSYGGTALIVAATGPSGGLASYSQRGAGVTLAAPGGDSLQLGCDPSVCVKSLFPGNKTALLEGTSMAAPHVAGVAALLQAQLARSPAQIRQVLTSTARPLTGAGAGRLDAAAALAAGTAASAPVRRAPPTSAPAPSPSPAGAAPAPRTAEPAQPAPPASSADPARPAPAAPAAAAATTAPAGAPTVADEPPAAAAAQGTSGADLATSPATAATGESPARTPVAPQTADAAGSAGNDITGNPAVAVAVLLLLGVGAVSTRALRAPR